MKVLIEKQSQINDDMLILLSFYVKFASQMISLAIINLNSNYQQSNIKFQHMSSIQNQLDSSQYNDESTQSRHNPSKRKLIHKNHSRIRTRSSMHEHCQSDQVQTVASPTTENCMSEEDYSLRNVFFMIRDLVGKLRYSLDTYLVCLNILEKIKFKVGVEKCKLLASGIVMICGKIHEFKTPKFMNLIVWSGHQFNSPDLILVESQLLAYFDFKITVVIKAENQSELEKMVVEKEQSLFALF